MPIITCENLSKTYTYFEKGEGLGGSLRALFRRRQLTRHALTDLSLQVEPGEFVGLMGANGAGKTTLMKLLSGIILPTGGELTVCGVHPHHGGNAFKKRFALVMGQKSQLWWDLPASDSLRLNQVIYEVDEQRYRRQVGELTERFEVARYLAVPVRKLSLGERMKFELIAALLHEPELLLLDEPTIGLDAVAQRQIRAMLRQIGRDRGVTLLLTSHYTEDLLELTDRCAVLRSGQLLYDGNLNALLDRYHRHSTVVASFRAPVALPETLPAAWDDPCRARITLPREQVQRALAALSALPELADIQIEQEDAALLVERMYQSA